jgi:hypothetical protein
VASRAIWRFENLTRICCPVATDNSGQGKPSSSIGWIGQKVKPGSSPSREFPLRVTRREILGASIFRPQYVRELPARGQDFDGVNTDVIRALQTGATNHAT